MLVIVTGNPFFNCEFFTEEQIESFCGLRLIVHEEWEEIFGERIFFVSLFELHSKLSAPHYDTTRLILKTHVCSYLTMAEVPFFEEVAKLIYVPLRASACMITNGAIH